MALDERAGQDRGSVVQMNVAFTVAGMAVAAMLGAQEPPAAAVRTWELPVSVERIRQALERSEGPPLRLLEQRADFHVEIRQTVPFQYPPDLLDVERQVPRPDWAKWFVSQPKGYGQVSPTLAAIDLLAIGGAIGRSIGKAYRARAERAAREEVRRSLAEFCAAQDCSGR